VSNRNVSGAFEHPEQVGQHILPRLPTGFVVMLHQALRARR